MNILLKYPTRGRPRQFAETLSGWLRQASDLERVSVLVTCDEDDASMSDDVLDGARASHPRLAIRRDANRTKIEACNRGLFDSPWDVVLAVSDDMFCCRPGWDDVVRSRMLSFHGGTDGALWFHDGCQRAINTIECVGRARCERFGYLYHPDYASFYCDNESTLVGLRDGKLPYIEDPICTHEHPAWGRSGVKYDGTYERNSSWWQHDRKIFEERRLAGFPTGS